MVIFFVVRYKQFGIINSIELTVNEDHLLVARRKWFRTEQEQIAFRDVLINRMQIDKKPYKLFLLLTLICFFGLIRLVIIQVFMNSGSKKLLDSEFAITTLVLLYFLFRWIFTTRKEFLIPVKEQPFVRLDYDVFNSGRIKSFAEAFRKTAGESLKQKFLFSDHNFPVETLRGRIELLKDLEIISADEYKKHLLSLNDGGSTHYHLPLHMVETKKIVVPINKMAEEALDKGKTVPYQLIEFQLSPHEFEELWKSGFFNEMNDAAGLSISDFSTASISSPPTIKKILKSGLFAKYTAESKISHSVSRMEELFKEALEKETSIHFYF